MGLDGAVFALLTQDLDLFAFLLEIDMEFWDDDSFFRYPWFAESTEVSI